MEAAAMEELPIDRLDGGGSLEPPAAQAASRFFI